LLLLFFADGGICVSSRSVVALIIELLDVVEAPSLMDGIFDATLRCV
jgi:hypothetical protein